MHQIGVGALGPVFRTYEPDRDRLVAVKAFRLDITPEQAEALAAEMSRAAEAGLFHPSIVEPLAAGVEGSAAYRAEEYVAAESLDVALRQYAPAPVDTVLPFITQLAGAIDFARAAGIGHGGLHLRDVFITPDEARATGFGVVEALERVGIRAPVRRPYAPPERIAGESWSTPADVFSLAAITYELLTGRRPAGWGPDIGPLTAGTPNGWMDALQAVLARGMAEDPAARFQTALEFASALETAARGQASAGAVPLVAAASAAPVAAVNQEIPASVLQDAPVEPDDIFLERDEDEAHHQLSLDDIGEAAPARPGLQLDDDSEVEAAADADRFILDVAAAASAQGPSRFDELSEPLPATELRGAPVDDLRDADVVPVPVRRPVEPARRRDSDAAPVYPPGPRHQAINHPATGPSTSRRAWPIALLVMVGVLAGLGGGYALWGRPAPDGLTLRDEAGAGVTGGGNGGVPTAEATSPESGAQVSTASAAAEDAPAATGSLIVRSSPSGAGVTLNGTWRGRTPVTVADLPLGRQNLRVVQPGYAPATRTVTLSVGKPDVDLTLRLQAQKPPAPAPAARAASAAPRTAARPQSYSGAIYVDSRPRGATVVINGKPMGVTPLLVPEMRIGTHVVRLELRDHRTWSSTARVTAGGEVRVTGSLEPNP